MGDPRTAVAQVGQGLVGVGRMTKLQDPQFAAHLPLAAEDVLVVVVVVSAASHPDDVVRQVVEQGTLA